MEHEPSKIKDYAETEKHMMKFLVDALITAPSPESVADTVLKIINAKVSKYSYPVGSGSSFLPFLQYISYRLFEKGFIKNANWDKNYSFRFFKN